MAKYRNWRLTSYLTEDMIKYVLTEHTTQIKAFAYILHDKDITEEGKPKTPHYHLLLCLHNGQSLEGLLKWFSNFVDESCNDVNTLAKVMNNRKGAYAYLTHNTSASRDKYQYSADDIVGFNVEFFDNDDDEREDKLSSAVFDLLAGSSVNDCVYKYGRDFIIHYGHIKNLLVDIKGDVRYV